MIKLSMIGRLIAASVLALGTSSVLANMFTPGAPCNGCTIEIFDHAGINQTSKNAVYRVNNPQTPNGTPPWLELYNPTLATIPRLKTPPGCCQTA